MKTITLVTELSGSEDIRYIPVPCRGNVHSMRLACDGTMVAEKTVILSRSTTAVNTATAPAGGTAAGTTLDGVPDATNLGLIFDPASSTAANQVIKVVVLSAFVGSAATLTIQIKYDDGAFVEQTSIQA